MEHPVDAAPRTGRIADVADTRQAYRRQSQHVRRPAVISAGLHIVFHRREHFPVQLAFQRSSVQLAVVAKIGRAHV